MITVSDIKRYLKFEQSNQTQDTFFSELINNARSKIETYCNRNFKYKTYTEYQDGSGTGTLYVDAYPIKSITSIKYYDTTTNTYLDLINGSGDTIANSVIFKGNTIKLRKGYVFPTSYEPDNIKIVYTGGFKCVTGTGTVSITVGSKSLSGSSTLFTTEAEAGDIIQSEGQDLEISAITNATALSVLSNASASISSKSYVIKSVPADLKQVMLEMVYMMYQDSSQGKSRLGIAAENVGSQASQSFTFKEVDWKITLDKYLNMSI